MASNNNDIKMSPEEAGGKATSDNQEIGEKGGEARNNNN